MFGRGFRIGRLAGITIRVDLSWLLIVAIITWNLSTIFTHIHPAWPTGMIWSLSIISALLFFASILAHEMAHSLVALSYGIPVQDITLFLFGGVAKIEHEPATPKIEFLMAIAGPAMSLVLGLLLLAASLGEAWVGRNIGDLALIMSELGAAKTIFLWLGSVNIILAVFNMIPGFPLDGGRVLRSFLWAMSKNLRQATFWASWTGRLIAWMMIVTGLVMLIGINIPFLGTGLLNGIWLIFVGWFLRNASIQSYQSIALQEVLTRVSVDQIMRRNPPTVEPSWTISDLMEYHDLKGEDLAFPVLEDQALVGMVSLDDMRRISRDDWDKTHLGEIMTPQPQIITIAPEENASEAMDKLANQGVRHLPVVRSNCQFVGLLRRRDLIRWLQIHNISL